jgi:hypothetical protein
MQRISWLAEELLASQEGLRCTEIFVVVVIVVVVVVVRKGIQASRVIWSQSLSLKLPPFLCIANAFDLRAQHDSSALQQLVAYVNNGTSGFYEKFALVLDNREYKNFSAKKQSLCLIQVKFKRNVLFLLSPNIWNEYSRNTYITYTSLRTTLVLEAISCYFYILLLFLSDIVLLTMIIVIIVIVTVFVVTFLASGDILF